MLVCKIWDNDPPSIRFDIRLQNFKKPLENRKENVPENILLQFGVLKKALSDFLASSSSLMKNKHQEANLSINLSFKLEDSGVLEAL